jgi:hypothetical protein
MVRRISSQSTVGKLDSNGLECIGWDEFRPKVVRLELTTGWFLVSESAAVKLMYPGSQILLFYSNDNVVSILHYGSSISLLHSLDSFSRL